MPELDVRPLRDGELRAYINAVARSFGDEQSDADFASNERIFETDRVFVAADGDAVVGGGASFSFQLTVPGGGEIGAAGVTAVGVVPTHRRRGALRKVMRLLLEDAQRHADPVAILYASEGSIYQRFGYGMGTLQAEFEIVKDHSAFRTQVPAEGSMRLLDPEEAARVLPIVFDQVRARTPGFISRSEAWWESEIIADPERWRHGAGPKGLVVHEVDGVAEGYVIYRVKNEWDAGAHKSTLLVRELIATTVRAQRELWQFCLAHDLIQTVRAVSQPADHPLLLMLAEPRRLRLVLGEQLWLRIVDVAGALDARTYAASGRVVLDLADTFLPELAGRWLLDTTGDRPRVERTDKAADMALDVTDLACLYLGAFSATDLAAAGRTTELTPGTRECLDAIFRVERRPWCPTNF